MRNYELSAYESYLAVTALRFITRLGYTYEDEPDGDFTQQEYDDMKALIERLDPKPVKKSGWMNVYTNASAVHETKEDADKYAGASRVKCVEVFWEE